MMLNNPCTGGPSERLDKKKGTRLFQMDPLLLLGGTGCHECPSQKPFARALVTLGGVRACIVREDFA